MKSADYDGDFLYYLTAALTEESENVSEDDMSTYFAETCPAGVREGGEDGSGSGSRDNGGGGSNYARYGSIKVMQLLFPFLVRPEDSCNLTIFFFSSLRGMVMLLNVVFAIQTAPVAIATSKMNKRRS